MKPRLLVILGGCLLLLAVIKFASAPHPPPGPSITVPTLSPTPVATTPIGSTGAVTPTAIQSPAPATPERAPSQRAPAFIPPEVQGERAAALIDLDKINRMLRDYRTLFGENPVGTNAEIMKAIMGGNSKGAMLGPPEGISMGNYGQLLDRWGTPIFFHQISSTHTEIWSAGPDKKMGTDDDVILK